MGWHLTVRKIDYVMDAMNLMDKLAKHGCDPDDIDDDFLDRQLDALESAGRKQGQPYNVKRNYVKVA